MAFAEPETEAIYDSRTAVALNCCLAKQGIMSGFHMPQGRNKAIVPVYRLLKNIGFKQVYGYKEYLDLLRHMSQHHPDGDIFGVEMALFANAPAVASEFMRSLGASNE